MKKELTTQAIVLTKRTSGENFLHYSLFSPEHGALNCLKRISNKPGSSTIIELFDVGQFRIESKGEDTFGLIHEFTLEERFDGLVKSYQAFNRASQFVLIFTKNKQHIESSAEAYALCLKSLRAFNKAVHPSIVLLKSLYLFSQSEGYPVKEEWQAQLPVEQRQTAIHLVRTPLADLTDNEPITTSILNNLIRWMRTHTDFYIPDTLA